MVTLPFPQPGTLVAAAYWELDQAENGTADENVSASWAVRGAAWDPPSCPPALREQVWAWLDAVAGWVNHEYAWGVERLIPPCWPAHPHIAHELAVLADLRRTAGRDTTSVLLEYWHRDSLPMFLERMHVRLAGSCAAGHQDWTAAARYRAFHNDVNQAQRQARFTADCQTSFRLRPRTSMTTPTSSPTGRVSISGLTRSPAKSSTWTTGDGDRRDRGSRPPPSSTEAAGEPDVPPRRESRAPVDEDARRERLEQFHTRLSESVLSMTSGTAWADWLQTAARFHHYSFRNTVAIWAQRPEADPGGRVPGVAVDGPAGAQGERGIEILAPVTRRADDSEAGPRAPAGTGHIPGLPTPPARTVVGYRIAHVFDISQTDLMADIADVFAIVQPALLTGQAPEHLWEGLARQVDEAGYRLVVEPLTGGTNGRTHFVDRVVTVTPDLEPAHRVKTLSHELAHVTLHEPDVVAAQTDSPMLVCRGRIEVEAESVAFLIAAAHDLDSSAFSFAYVAGWAPAGRRRRREGPGRDGDPGPRGGTPDPRPTRPGQPGTAGRTGRRRPLRAAGTRPRTHPDAGGPSLTRGPRPGTPSPPYGPPTPPGVRPGSADDRRLPA